MLSALAIGVVGLLVLLWSDLPWAAVGLCAGIALGIGNFRLVVRSVLKVGARAEENKRRPLALNTLGRLMAMTVVALVLAWFVTPLGLGMIGGIALFQFVLLANVTSAMLRGGDPGAGTSSASQHDGGAPIGDGLGAA